MKPILAEGAGWLSRPARALTMSSYKRLRVGAGAFATTFLVEEVNKSGATDKKKQQLVMKRVPCSTCAQRMRRCRR